MFNLLNRISWVLSVVLWYLLFELIFRFLSFLYFDLPILFEIFFLIIFWVIIKNVFFSKKFIESRLKFFVNQIKKDLMEEKVLDKEKLVEDSLKYKKSSSEIEGELVDGGIKNNKHSEIEDSFLKNKIEDTKIENNFYKNESWKDILVNKNEKKEPNFIVKFFSENLLAKLGWIIIFIWVVFLLWLIYSNVWPVLKIIFWFAIWFICFITWVFLDKKWFLVESRVLLWVWILINYAVILSWRYLIQNDFGGNLLQEWVTFFFLILNTIFSIMTSLVYNSKLLLLFSFVFAFLNPILVWWKSDSPYTLVGYSFIVAFWGLILSTFKSISGSSRYLFYTSFIGFNILVLLTPFKDEIWWIIKIVSFTILVIFSIFINYKQKREKDFLPIFILSYLFLVLLLFNWWFFIDNFLKSSLAFIFSLVSIFLLFISWVALFLLSSVSIILYTLFLPLIILPWLLFFCSSEFIVFTLIFTVFIYLLAFLLLFENILNIFKYIFFVFLWVFIFIINLFSIYKIWFIELSNLEFFTAIWVSLLFLIVSYLFSIKKNLWYLYSIWTIFWVIALLPIIYFPIKPNIQDIKLYFSILSVTLFALLNWFLPFINKNLIEKKENFKNLVIWLIFWWIFLVFVVFNYGKIYFSWIILWYIFALIAIIYFIIAYLMILRIWVNFKQEDTLPNEKVKEIQKDRNIIYIYYWISISLFSLAIAYVFWEYDEVVASIWIFESSLLFYFFSKIKDVKIYIAWIIVFLIWLVKLFLLLSVVQEGKFWFLVSFLLIFIFMIFNLKSLYFIKENSLKKVHDILHIIWIICLSFFLVKIIPYQSKILILSIFILALSLVYSLNNSKILKIFFLIYSLLFVYMHLIDVRSIFYSLDEKNSPYYFKILHYISSLLFASTIVIFNFFEKISLYKNILFSLVSVYLFLITTIYIHDIFNSVFSITIYWVVLSFSIVSFWIIKNFIKFRTIWLYILILILIKIFFYDIWIGFNDSILRVLALIIVWSFMIMLSFLYSKKYSSNLKWEFDIKNLFDINDYKYSSTKNEVNFNNNDKIEKDSNFLINRKIENIDVWEYFAVKFVFNNWEKILIKAVNLIKIAKFVVDNLWKTTFKKQELDQIYKYIVKNYNTQLPKSEYNKILKIIEKFIQEWWSIEFLKKEKE